MRVGDSGDEVLGHGYWIAFCDDLGDEDPVGEAPVRELLARNEIADGVDTRMIRGKSVIDTHESSVHVDSGIR